MLRNGARASDRVQNLFCPDQKPIELDYYPHWTPVAYAVWCPRVGTEGCTTTFLHVPCHFKITTKMPASVRVFTVPELSDATGDFAEDRVIGRGGFSRVYRGTLPSGEAVAVKRLADGSSVDELMTEINTLATLEHANLLPILGFAHQARPPDLMLVTPHMPRGSLHDALHGAGSDASTLDAAWRVSFLASLARGLRALHAAKIVHRDVKSANVLIGDDGRAVLGDAGTARRMRDDADVDDARTRTRLVGTDGYLDPEYQDTEELTYKSDVFGFGVVALELVTGLRAYVQGGRPPILWRRFRSVRPDDLDERVRRVVDAAADPWRDAGDGAETVEAVARVALRATAKTNKARPSAAVLVAELESLRARATASVPPPRECIVCMEAVREVRLDCGHMTMCEACTAELMEDEGPRCPQCRAPARRLARLEADAADLTFVAPPRDEIMEALRAWRDRNDELGECLQRMWRPWPQDASEWVRERNTSNGATALYYAARFGEHELVKILLEAGAVINTATNDGCTPLYIAAQNGREAVVRGLVEAGADVNKAVDNGATPLHVAAHNGHEAVARGLVEAGADVNKATDDGATPLCIATVKCHRAIARLLTDAGAV